MNRMSSVMIARNKLHKWYLQHRYPWAHVYRAKAFQFGAKTALDINKSIPKPSIRGSSLWYDPYAEYLKAVSDIIESHWNICLWYDGTFRAVRGHRGNCKWRFDGYIWRHL